MNIRYGQVLPRHRLLLLIILLLLLLPSSLLSSSFFWNKLRSGSTKKAVLNNVSLWRWHISRVSMYTCNTNQPSVDNWHRNYISKNSLGARQWPVTLIYVAVNQIDRQSALDTLSLFRIYLHFISAKFLLGIVWRFRFFHFLLSVVCQCKSFIMAFYYVCWTLLFKHCPNL